MSKISIVKEVAEKAIAAEADRTARDAIQSAIFLKKGLQPRSNSS